MLDLKRKSDGCDYVFTRDGKPIKNFYNASKTALEKAGLYRKGIGFSAIRSTVATMIKEMTGSPLAAAEALGQKDPKVTLKHYIAVDPKKVEKNLKQLSELLDFENDGINPETIKEDGVNYLN